MDTMTTRYVHTGGEHVLRVRGCPTSQEELRFDAQRAVVRGNLAERNLAAGLLVLLDLVEGYQDLVDHLMVGVEAS